MKHTSYRIARWPLNRWLRKNPQMVVPLLHDLMNFARVKLCVKEYDKLERKWESCRDMEDFDKINGNGGDE